MIEGKCLYFMKQKTDVITAQRHCEVIFGPDSKGTLYEPLSTAEHNKVLEEAGLIFAGINDAYMFIGLMDRDEDGIMRYLTTESITYLYDLWDKDQPSGSGRFVVTQARKNGKWSKVYRYLAKYYSVCEKI